jgi:hypothetical protein
MKSQMAFSIASPSYEMKGFNPKWCEWTKIFMKGRSVGITFSDDIGHYLQTRMGL